MAQHDYVIDNQTSSQFRVDLNNALAAIVSQNSGDTEPATPFASQVWYDTLNNLLKQRNESNSAWITLGTVNEGTGKFEPNQTFATQAEAEAGTVDTVAMTPLKTAQAIAALSTSGGSSDYQVFTASGTWTKPVSAPASALVFVEAWGGGGGGGRISGLAGGGGGGGYMTERFTAGDITATVTTTVGAGGAGRTGSTGNGTAGGNSTFGSYVTAYGGGGGGQGGNGNGGGGGGEILAGTTAGAGGLLGGGSFNGGDALTIYAGGGGGSEATKRTGGNAVYGGGGGTVGSGAGGLSLFAGAGGANAAAGSAPSGGGGTAIGVNGGNGARGEIRVLTVW